MEFYTQWNRPPKQPEINNDPDMVEPGRVPTMKQQVEDFLLAGVKLDMSRRMRYDWPGDVPIDEDYYDPTRYKGFDAAEACQRMVELENKRRAIRRSKNVEIPVEESQAKPNLGPVDNSSDSGNSNSDSTPKT